MTRGRGGSEAEVSEFQEITQDMNIPYEYTRHGFIVSVDKQL